VKTVLRWLDIVVYLVFLAWAALSGSRVTPWYVGLCLAAAAAPWWFVARWQLALTIDAEVGRLTFDLRPPALDDLWLEETLRLLVTDWAATSSITVDLHTRGLDHERIPAPLETGSTCVYTHSLGDYDLTAPG